MRPGRRGVRAPRLVAALGAALVVATGCADSALFDRRPAGGIVTNEARAEADDHVRAARAALDAGDLDGAAERGLAAVRLDPYRPEVDLVAADAVAARARRDQDPRAYDDAVQLAHRAVEAAPRDADAWLVLARLESRRNYHSHALAAYERALELRPHDHAALKGCAWTHRILREPKAERRAWEDLVAAAPQDAEARLFLGVLLLQAGDEEHARGVSEIEQAVQLAPADDLALQTLAAVRAETGDLTGAETLLRRAVAAAQGRPEREADTLFNLGAVLQREGKNREARDAYEQCLVVAPEHARAHANLGLALLDLGQNAEARTRLRQALEFGVDHAIEPEVRAALARADAASAGRPDEDDAEEGAP